MKKYFAEFLGTFILVLLGCGAATTFPLFGEQVPSYIGIALAFGFVFAIIYYCFAHISGAHVNPAVSLGMLITKQLSFADFLGYLISQILGAFAGAGVLLYLVNNSVVGQLFDGGQVPKALGGNTFGAETLFQLPMTGAIVLEIILAFIFVLLVINAYSNEKLVKRSGIIIAASLAGVYLFGLPFTGVGLNPAKSLAVGVLTGGATLSQVWVFVVAPFVGAAIAAVVYLIFAEPKTESEFADYIDEDLIGLEIDEIVDEDGEVEEVVFQTEEVANIEE